MKKLALLFVFAFVAAFTASAQSNNAPSQAEFQWTPENRIKDFGKIPQGTPVTAVFKFKNTGKVPLVISNVQASCGCTVPSYTQAPIAPGETGEIKATYNAASPGVFNKSVTVTANVKEGSVILFLKGDVETKAANQ